MKKLPKKDLREYFLKNRTPKDMSCCDNVLKDVKVIGVYYPFKKEPNLQNILEYAWEHGIITLMPRVMPDKKMIFCPFTKDTILTPNQYGIHESHESPHKGDIDVIFVPGLAFDQNGTRLGYGGGYYDRFLQDKNVYKVGVCYHDEFVQTLPRENHDIPMDAILTDRGLVKTK